MFKYRSKPSRTHSKAKKLHKIPKSTPKRPHPVIFTSHNFSSSYDITEVTQQSNESQLTPVQKLTWSYNKLRPVVQKSLHYFLTQYQVTPPPTINEFNCSQPAAEAILESVLQHKLLVPKHSKADQEISDNTEHISNIIVALSNLHIIPKSWKEQYSIGFIPTNLRYVPGQFYTDPTNTEQIVTAQTHVHNIVDQFRVCLGSCGYYDVAGTFSTEDYDSETLAALSKPLHPPQGEDETTDFAHQKLAYFDNKKEEFADIKQKLFEIQTTLQRSQNYEDFDAIAHKYNRNDITQAYVTSYGANIPDIKVYTAMLVQQAAQSLLHQKYLNTPNQTTYYSTLAFDPISQAILAKSAETSGSNNDTELNDHLIEAHLEKTNVVLATIQQALPEQTYPHLNGAKVSFPEHFLANKGLNQHKIVNFTDELISSNFPEIATFRDTELKNASNATILRELALKHFRHDITMYYNVEHNEIFQKFRTQADLTFTPENVKDLNILKQMILDLKSQNVLDYTFKSEFVPQEFNAWKVATQDLDIPQWEESVKDRKKYTAEATNHLQFHHVLAEASPHLAQRCYEVTTRECEANLIRMQEEEIKRRVTSAFNQAIAELHQKQAVKDQEDGKRDQEQKGKQ